MTTGQERLVEHRTPHPALIELAAGRPLPTVPSDAVDGLLASAAEHRMTGLLWSRVADGHLDVPKPAMMELARTDLRTRAHHLRLWEIATMVRDRLGDHGIGVAMAKGVAAEARWYDRIGERPAKDVDLLLEPGAEQRLSEVFDALEPRVRHGDAALLLTTGYLQSIDLDVEDVEVDLHTDIFKIGVPTRQIDVMWRRIRKVAGPHGTAINALDPELSFVHFLLHLNRDRFRFLLGFADIGQIMRREELDWEFIADFVRREGFDAIVYSALDAVVTTLDLAYPPLPRPRGLRAGAWRRLWPAHLRLQRRTQKAIPYRRQYYIPLLARGRFVEAARCVVRRQLLPPRSIIDLHHGDVPGPYLVRLVLGRWRQQRRERRREAGPPTFAP